MFGAERLVVDVRVADEDGVLIAIGREVHRDPHHPLPGALGQSNITARLVSDCADEVRNVGDVAVQVRAGQAGSAAE